jgi:hypothetical protein
VYAKDGKDRDEPRYLICIPQGGLIDMCNVILRCHKYAVANNRILIIDTSLGWYNDDINKYINIYSPYVYTGAPDTIYHKIKDLSIFPQGVNIMNMNSISKREDVFYINNIPVSYDLDHDHPETIMVYSLFRLGNNGFTELLNFCGFSNLVLDAYKSARARLPQKYISIHVRNTDYTSDVAKFIETHDAEFTDTAIFLGSDNKKTINQFKERYGKNLYSFAYIPDNGGKPIHDGYKRTKAEAEKYNIETFVDILLLASADEYYYSFKGSGFSQAVMQLRDEPRLLHRLLNPSTR